jgi:anaerobic dimethyl sulfoxide reductase subunit A
MSENKKESIADKQVSRRSMLKWTGALAAAAVVGAVAEYGASELLKPPPPPPVSFKPPLSSAVAARVDAIKKQLIDLHSGESYYYMNCTINGCSSCGAFMKVRVKNGVVTAVEPGDDTINQGMGREDAYITADAVNKNMVQARNGCPMGLGWVKDLYNPNRMIYPMKRVGQRGSGSYARISWDEALDTVAQNIKQARDKYGPYCVYNGVAQYSGTSPHEYLQGGMGFYGFGNASNGSITEANGWILGTNSWAATVTMGNDLPDLFNTKLAIFWGWNAAENYPNIKNYYLLLARERGMKIIVIDPRYTVDAEIYADQWIPIRRDTDTAMALALANVLFKENLVDQAFASKWIEPTGLQKYKDYVLGISDDKVDKTPEWAETITGVPAETIRELARLWAKSKPVALKVTLNIGRRQFGEDTSRALDFVTALTGNVGIPGAVFGAGGGIGSGARLVNVPSAAYTKSPAPTKIELVCAPKGNGDVVLQREKFDKGQITQDEFNKLVGNKPGNPMPNQRIISWGSNSLNNNEETNKRITVAKKMDFVWLATAYQDNRSPTSKYADIILPEAIEEFETFKGFASGGNINNTMMYNQKSINPPGEARPRSWTQQQIANRLGVGDKWNATLQNVTYDQWDQTLDSLNQKAYETWMARDDIKPFNPPSWVDFNKKPIFRIPLTQPWVGWRKELAGPGFPTDSGKIEFFSKYLDTATAPPSGKYLRTHHYLNSYGTAFAPMPKWAWYYKNGMNGRAGTHDPAVATYPLTLYSTHSYFRQHSLRYWNPWHRDEYRHAIWISVADAKARGIQDNDLVRVVSDVGESILPAYVTSRITPGGVDIYHGGWYTRGPKSTLMPDGIDTQGAINVHIDDVYPLCVTENSSGLVQVEKLS